MASSDTENIRWRTDILPKQTLAALEYFKDANWLSASDWYLAGGTALALQVGHRESVDLDFFITKKTFPAASPISHLPDDDWRSDIVEDGTVYGTLYDAKVSFIANHLFLPKTFVNYGNIPVLNANEVSIMKVVAISQRGKKRDFFDLYWCAKNLNSLEEILKKLPDYYPSVAHDYHHILKSMTFFEDAESDPMPVIHFDADWKEVKKFFEEEVPKLTQKLLGL